MTFRVIVLTLFAIFSGTAFATEPKEADVVGTWKWISVDGKAATETFYMRLYANGKAASWPAPKDWSTTVNGVSRGNWFLKEGYFVIDTGEGKDSPKSRISIKKDEMTFVTDDDVHLVYRRIVPDLEPGKLLSK